MAVSKLSDKQDCVIGAVHRMLREDKIKKDCSFYALKNRAGLSEKSAEQLLSIWCRVLSK